jgi:hypothetical protein
VPDTPLFIDTGYVYALINLRDQWHEKALAWQQKISAEKSLLLTTEFILAEIADGLAAVTFRQAAIQTIRVLTTSPFVQIIPASSELFQAGLALYESRADKDWGLTDCISFVVMIEHDLTEALTTDDHFRQAGFRPLLLEP